MKFKSAKSLFNTKQESTSIDDYFAVMQRLAKQVGADDTMLRFAILNGLRPEIATFVTQKQPADMKQLLDSARVAEMTISPPLETDSTISVQIAQVQQQLQHLTNRLDTPSAMSASESHATRSQRSPSPRRARFVDNGMTRPVNRFNSPYRRYNSPQRAYESSYRGYDLPMPPQEYQSREYQFPPPPADGSRGGGRGYGRPPRNFYGRRVMGSPRAEIDSQSCYRCGLRRHEHINQCRALNDYCAACGRIGHYRRVCRSVIRSQNNTQ